jgi:TonB family protein
MIRERTLLNLAIGLILSLLLHAYLVVWGPPLSLHLPVPNLPTEVEVQLQEWPTLPVRQALEEPVKIAESPPPAPMPVQPPKPAVPPDATALQEAVQAGRTDVGVPRMTVRLPEPPLPVPPFESSSEALRLAQSLAESLQQESSLSDLSIPPPLPEPARQFAERKELPPLPTLERAPRREAAPSRPATLSLPASNPANPASYIKGPAADRRVIFQPPLPSVTVENEAEIELRFWILPNGTVSRVVPLKKSDPRLETLAINYLRNWRFNPLPPDVPSEEQWGVIPFKFRIR